MNRLLALAFLAVGCSGGSATQAADPSLSEPPTPEVAEVETPSVAPVVEAEVDGALCQPYATERAIELWRERVISGLNTGDHNAVTDLLKCIDPGFSATLFERAVEWEMLADPRHLDADAEEEWVLQLRQHSETIGHGEREEFVWIAVLDQQGGEFRLAGTILRPKLSACLIPDKAGVSVEYTAETHSEDAVMFLLEQEVKACGTRVDVSYHKTGHRIRDGKLASEPHEPPAPKSWNRTEGAR